ncbi:MAG: GNAT family N-acetyltransferase [Candidatus Hodarchaeales archaeon]|jgi:ribosomal protein S18 acetylase RimI-like enzyme
MDNNLIDIQTKTFKEIDLHELAQFSYEERLAAKYKENFSTETIENWFRSLKFETPPIFFLAYLNEKLIGYIMLFIHNPTMGEINPWALGGHPIVLSDNDNQDIASLLMKQVFDYAQKISLTRLELLFSRIDNDEQFNSSKKAWYNSQGMDLMEELVFMNFNLSEFEVPNFELTDVKIEPLLKIDGENLYQCWYSTFITGLDRSILDKTDEEKRDYFNEEFSLSEPFIEKASLVLKRDKQIIGFSLVRSTHGEGNGHLWNFGIHPDYRRKKIGQSFLYLIMKKLKQHEFKTISLAVDLNNTPAYNLYFNLGFKTHWAKIAYSWKNNVK